MASESLGRGEAKAKELRASPAEMTWVEKRILENRKGAGKNNLKKKTWGFSERQCLGCYLYRESDGPECIWTGDEPPRKEPFVCSVWSSDTRTKKAHDVDRAGEYFFQGANRMSAWGKRVVMLTAE